MEGRMVKEVHNIMMELLFMVNGLMERKDEHNIVTELSFLGGAAVDVQNLVRELE